MRSRILENVGKRDIGRKFCTECLSPFLWTGVTLANLSEFGTIPMVIDKLNIIERGVAIA